MYFQQAWDYFWACFSCSRAIPNNFSLLRMRTCNSVAKVYTTKGEGGRVHGAISERTNTDLRKLEIMLYVHSDACSSLIRWLKPIVWQNRAIQSCLLLATGWVSWWRNLSRQTWASKPRRYMIRCPYPLISTTDDQLVIFFSSCKAFYPLDNKQ